MPSASTGTSSTWGPWRRMVLRVPENVGASESIASPTSRKALKASDSAWPEPLEMMRFSGVTRSPSNSSYLLADQLPQPAVALMVPVGQRLRALDLHHAGGRLDEPVVGEGRGVGKAPAELVERVHDRPGRRRRAAPADAAAGREQIVEADNGCGMAMSRQQY